MQNGGADEGCKMEVQMKGAKWRVGRRPRGGGHGVCVNVTQVGGGAGHYSRYSC